MFLDEDIDDVLDWLAVEDETCSGCGQPRHESFSPDSQDGYEARKLKCFACEARDQASHQYEGDRNGIYFTVSKAD